MRLKNRYLIAQLIEENDSKGESAVSLSSNDIIGAIRDSIQNIYGDIGAGLYGMSATIRYFDSESSRKIFVLRVQREFYRQVWFAMSCISSIKRVFLSIRMLTVAGCGRTCTAKIIGIMDRLFKGDPATFGSDDEYSKMRSKISELLLRG